MSKCNNLEHGCCTITNNNKCCIECDILTTCDSKCDILMQGLLYKDVKKCKDFQECNEGDSCIKYNISTSIRTIYKSIKMLDETYTNTKTDIRAREIENYMENLASEIKQMSNIWCNNK